MTSTIVFMMRCVHLSNTDLEMIEQACRAFAERYRRDAERQANPLIRGNALAVIGVATSIGGGVIGAVLVPWVNERVQLRKEAREEERRQAEERRKLIASWRAMVNEVSAFAAVTNGSAYDQLLGRADFQSLEAHCGRTFRGGISIKPALQIGTRMPAPLEDIAQAIDELEVQWRLRTPG